MVQTELPRSAVAVHFENRNATLTLPTHLYFLLLRAIVCSPSINIEILLPKERNYHRAICELPSRQGRKRLLRGVGLLVLDVDLADAVALSAAAGWAWHFDIEEGAIFRALFFDVFEDFCRGDVSGRPER